MSSIFDCKSCWLNKADIILTRNFPISMRQKSSFIVTWMRYIRANRTPCLFGSIFLSFINDPTCNASNAKSYLMIVWCRIGHEFVYFLPNKWPHFKLARQCPPLYFQFSEHIIHEKLSSSWLLETNSGLLSRWESLFNWLLEGSISWFWTDMKFRSVASPIDILLVPSAGYLGQQQHRFSANPIVFRMKALVSKTHFVQRTTIACTMWNSRYVSMKIIRIQ